jgi:hypothetical protein
VGRVIADQSVPLDGFSAGPNVRIGRDAADGKHLEIVSAPLGMPLLDRGLLDEVDLHVLPRLLGDGTRLYDVAEGSMRKVPNWVGADRMPRPTAGSAPPTRTAPKYRRSTSHVARPRP